MFWPESVILRGCNIAPLCKQQPIQNSAPNGRRLPEKPLQTLLTHENDHRWPKKGKIAVLEFHFDHLKGQHGRTLEASGFTPGGGVTYRMDLVFYGVSTAPHPDAHQKTTPGRGLEQAGESCTRRGRTATVWMTTGRTKNTKAKRPFRGGEGEKHENTGSMAQAPAARLRFCGLELVLPRASCPLRLPHWRKSLVRWAASIHAKWGKNMAKN